MIEFLLLFAFLWLVVKVMSLMIVLPFKFLSVLLQAPTSVLFWVAIAVLIFLVLRRSDDRSSAAYRMRELRRSQSNRWICGVCGGIAEYFRVDVTIVRLIFAGLFFLGGGTMLAAYLIAALIIPREY